MDRNPFKQRFAKMTRLGFKALARGITPSIASVPAGRPQNRLILDFSSSEGIQKATEWYQNQPTTQFTSLEYRKEKGMFEHEFIIVHLNRNTLCRFDRRAVECNRGDAMNDEGTLAEDSAHVMHSYQAGYQSALRETNLLLRIEFPKSEDLRFILAVCYAIQTHELAKSYSLLCYNCYFFSWTVTATIARRAYAWEAIVAPDSAWRDMIEESIDNTIQPSSGSGTLVQRPIYSTSSRIKAWFQRHAERNQDSFAPKHKMGAELLDEFQTTLKNNLNLEGYQASVVQLLEPILLKSQLTSAIASEVMQRVKRALWQTSTSLAKRKSLVAVEELVTSQYYGSRDLRKNSILNVAQWPLNEYLLLVEEGVSKATNAVIKAPSIDHSGYSTNNIPSTSSQNHTIWENIWDQTWESHWNGSMSPFPTPNEHNEIVNLGISASAQGRENWKMAWEAYTELGILIMQSLTKMVHERLVDLDPTQVEYGDSNKNQRSMQNMHWLRLKRAAGHSDKPGLQDFIRTRINKHFNRVDKHTFGSYEELRGKAENTMTEIWKTSLTYFRELASTI
ncbi:hypothetical protein RSOLAG1IB_07432 [Rhizoctonia solani AG-1 IB]|uniref:Uncharacterized protein n=1 Tax=Thanatephorus cucumeris (strain AG1-IB / isolate 7/3/14) TaxID=1108050 RepID=A0A0B7FBK5_THACB|nr:hypothetical protein RSOLAG1IB_07432 [Rhizoctonia solani AG-1 IB]